MCLQKWFSSAQYMRFLSIVAEPYLGVLVVLRGEVLEIIYEVHILGGLWPL